MSVGTSPKRRLAVIGLDGVGLDLARHLAGSGIMPNLGRLMEKGAPWRTESPLPEVSPVCWSSMFSGAGPGVHGVFGFAEPAGGSYSIKPVDSKSVACPRLWDEVSVAGGRSVVLNVPLTYPASPLNGVMVSGFVTPELANGVHPRGLLPLLEDLKYRPEAELELGREDPAELARDLGLALGARLRLFEQMLSEPWDLYVGVITDSDRVNHFLWPALWEPEHPLHPAAASLYRRMDGFIGKAWSLLEPEVAEGRAALLIAADHSFGPIVSEVYLNPWLAAEGFLQFDGGPGSEVILPQTRALALDPGRIYLHTAERFPGGGRFSVSEREALLGRLRDRLRALRYTRVLRTPEGGIATSVEAPIQAARLGRELYHGPAAKYGPDLVATPAPGYSLRAGLGQPGVFGLSHIKGAHRPTGALALCLPGPAEPPPTVAGLHGLMRGLLGL